MTTRRWPAAPASVAAACRPSPRAGCGQATGRALAADAGAACRSMPPRWTGYAAGAGDLPPRMHRSTATPRWAPCAQWLQLGAGRPRSWKATGPEQRPCLSSPGPGSSCCCRCRGCCAAGCVRQRRARRCICRNPACIWHGHSAHSSRGIAPLAARAGLAVPAGCGGASAMGGTAAGAAAQRARDDAGGGSVRQHAHRRHASWPASRSAASARSRRLPATSSRAAAATRWAWCCSAARRSWSRR